ncbi:TonB-dependent receptor [Steroidobacter sp.]|uniref:TonB-dependent receptor n=1 Tax=Steroidobacter sp. TaxID=1978227 RepID=UPI001A4FE4B7|nr:TonB-dependent receptor [Steroidobacter sp.]MBL8271283.1 TonB-dependent receptor [Steroidobacter sp.]
MSYTYKAVSLALIGLTLGASALAQEASQESDSDRLEEIVVTGTRAALAESLSRKRDAPVVQDSIVAEDLGRFPDDNVADSLSHITGITLQRTRGGEGQYVNVRGLGPEFSIVTLNNRILATDGDGREFAFDVLPSEVISGADVFKSATAVNLEGSIGGAINLSSARPLDRPGLRTSLSVEGDYSDLSENSGYKVSGVFSDTFAEDRMGIMLTAVYQDTEVRSDAVHEFYITPDSPGAFDANGDGEISAAESDLLGLCCTSFGTRIQDKKRSGVTAVWQWQVNDSLQMTVDGMFTRLDAPTVGYHQSYYVEDSILDEDAGLHRWSDVNIRDHWVTGMSIAELIPEISTITEHRVVDTTQFGWNAVWQSTDSLKFTFDAYQSKAERDSGGKDTWMVSGIGGSHTGRVDMNSGGLPNISVTLEDGRDLATALQNGALGNADYGLHYIGLSGTDVTDEVTGLSIGGELQLQFGALQSLQFGVAGTERAKTRNTFENDTNGGSCQYCNMYDTTFQSLGANVVRSVSLPNFMRNAGGSYPRRFVSFDANAYLNALRALDGQPILDEHGDPTGDVYDASLTAPAFNPVQSYDVEEDTVALYLNANLKGDAWFASAGVRWVSTDTTAKTAVDSIVFVDDPTPEVPTSSPDITYSAAEPLTQKGSYSKLLPSFNVGYWLRRDLLLRVAAAKVMARPSLNQLAPTRIDNTLDRTYLVIYDGNADLKPVEADQADLSAEWYFADKSVLSGALFWKHITGFITSELQENIDIGVVGNIGGAGEAPVLYDVSRPINGDKAKVLGVELGLQHFFDNGFGVRANYTYTDTKAYVGGVHVGPLENVSESAYSVALMFENDRWDVQLAADYSGKYTEVSDSVADLSQEGEPITWVTASVAYKITDGLSVSLEGRNLLDEYYVAYLGGRRDMLAGFETWGRSYLLGASAKF